MSVGFATDGIDPTNTIGVTEVGYGGDIQDSGDSRTGIARS